MTTKDQHAAKADHPATPAHDAPAAAPAAPPAPLPPVKGRKVVQVAVETNGGLLIAACDDGTLWSYGIGPQASKPVWNPFPPILTDEQSKTLADEKDKGAFLTLPETTMAPPPAPQPPPKPAEPAAAPAPATPPPS